MRVWLDQTINLIKALKPKKVLEIGCGTGLVLSQIAPLCEEYIGTDFSKPAIDYVQGFKDTLNGINPIKLIHCEADQIADMGSVDTVIINSVVQYFPHIDYLFDVIQKAVNLVTGNGTLFIGDVRNLLLLETFHESVIRHQSPDSPAPELKQRVSQKILEEEELVVDPAFFVYLKNTLPVTNVRILPKRGDNRNELTCFRYDVILSIGEEDTSSSMDINWHDWNTELMIFSRVKGLLENSLQKPLGIRHIPNARIQKEGIDPEAFWNLEEDSGYRVEISWLNTDQNGSYDVIFTKGSDKIPASDSIVNKDNTSEKRTFNDFANTPLQTKFKRKFVHQLRKYLQEHLPDYMVPSAIVKLDALPLTINGKIDREALPLPEKNRLMLDSDYLASRTPHEHALVEIWQNVLGIEQIGIQDNFFELGGDSLKALQTITRAKERNIQISFENFFKNPTIEVLLKHSTVEHVGHNQAEVDEEVDEVADFPSTYPLSPLQEGMLYHIIRSENDEVYQVQFMLEIEGVLDQATFKKACEAVVNRHPALRTSFHWEGIPEPVQTVADQVQVPFYEKYLQDIAVEEQHSLINSFIKQERRAGFTLNKAPLLQFSLFRLSNHTYKLIFHFIHLILSEWELFIVFKEIFNCYDTFKAGEDIKLPPVRPYYDFIAYIQNIDKDKMKVFWTDYLRGYFPEQLPIIRKNQGTTDVYNEIQIPLTADLTERLTSYAKHHRITLNTLLTGAYAILLSRYYRNEDIAFGMVFSGRNIDMTGIENTVGLFINTLPLRTDVGGDRHLLSWMEELQNNVFELSQYEHSSLVEIQGWSRVSRGQSLFETILVFDEEPLDSYLNKQGYRLNIKQMEILFESTNYPLTFAVLKGENIAVRAIFNEAHFDALSIKNMVAQYRTVLENIISTATNSSLKDISLVSAAEYHKLVVQWNDTFTDYPRDKCIQQLFEEQVAKVPAAVALIFSGQEISYFELNRRSNQLAHYLQRQGIQPKALIGISMARSVEMIVGLLAILKVGGAYVPIDPCYPEERIAFMIKDTGIVVLLTHEKVSQNRLYLSSVKTLCVDTEWNVIALEREENLPGKTTTSKDFAYITYTSGSTGTPKGVIITHQNVVRLVQGTDYANLTSEEVFLQFAPISFDASTFEIWGALVNGARLLIMHLQRPSLEELGKVLREYQVTTLWLTAGLFHQMVDERLEDLKDVRQLLAGGDVLSMPHVKKVLATRKEIKLINGYGPTENTTFTCCFPLSENSEINTTIPIGRPIANTQVYIVDQYLHPVPPELPGELLISGDGLGLGYLNRPELTKEKFIPNPFSNEPGSRIYRTGDLVRYRADGNIEFIGRFDDQVKVRGFRIELPEIELALRQHSDIQDVVVITREDQKGDKQLVAYMVPDKKQVAVAEIRAFLKKKLPDYMLPSVFMILPALPLTANGKIDKRALPDPDTNSILTNDYVPPKTPEEELLAEIWTDVLNIERVGILDNFFELGGHSLLATRVISRIRDTFNVELPMSLLFDFPTVAGLMVQISTFQKDQNQIQSLTSVTRDKDLPLSFAQQRLWFIDNFSPDNPAYNVVAGLILTGKLDKSFLEKGLTEIVKRHESLRTSFPAHQGSPLQKNHSAIAVSLPLIELSGMDEKGQKREVEHYATKNYLTTFKLSEGSLVRFILLRLAADRHIFFIAMHHIISDGWSLGIFYKELAEYYNAFLLGKEPSLPNLPIQYPDFAVEQRKWFQGEIYEKQLEYWQRKLANLPTLKFPTDHPRPVVQTFSGAGLWINIPEDITKSLEIFSRKSGATLFMVLLSAFFVLLSRYTGQKDISIGSPIANRNRSEIEGVIGFFVNTLALRADLSGNPTFKALVTQLREVTINAYAHQDFPFEKLVEELQPERSTSVNPLVQVVFALQSSPMELPELKELEVKLFDYQVKTTRFDLEFHFWRKREGLAGLFIYNTELFKEETCTRFLRHFERLLKEVIENPEQPIENISILTDSEKKSLLFEVNQTVVPYPDKPIHVLFEEYASKCPHAKALVMNDRSLSYGELNERANQLSHYLKAQGVCPETPVGIYMPRSFEMNISLLAILKAGGFYVPLDMENPIERLLYIIEDIGIKIILTKKADKSILAEHVTTTVSLEKDWPEISGYSRDNDLSQVLSKNLCYVTYTSGSTGKPKGVSIVHKGVVRLVKNSHYVSLNKDEIILQFAPLAFDASTFEIWGALLNGATIVIATPEKPTLHELGKLIKNNKVTTLWLTASLFHLMAAEHLEEMASVKQLLAGGDVLSPETVRKVTQRFRDCTVINGYGPTENTTFTCCYPMQYPVKFGDTVPIGKPISNTTVYILDHRMQLVPKGVVGELYTGGDGLARGYWQRPELTKERFVTNPFSNREEAMLYRTGDLVRLRWDDTIEFIGRSDDQVKIRGFRIEPGEIDRVLNEHPAVKESLTLAIQEKADDKHLISYVVPDLRNEMALAELQRETTQVVEEWEVLFDENIYGANTKQSRSEFNFVGWNDTATGKAIPTEEMQVWATYRIEQLQSLKPERVLEIGCGMGIILLQMAPHTKDYVGTDISHKALDYVAEYTKELPQVRLINAPAHDFSSLQTNKFDLCILNSTVQYFPGVDYLLKILDNVINTINPGGCIFIGDVRNLALLKAFHAGVQLYKADPLWTKEQVRQKVNLSVFQESELVIDPIFFSWLPSRYPQISNVRIQLQQGRVHNELTRYRYDVFLYINNTHTINKANGDCLKWPDSELTLAELRNRLTNTKPAHLCLTHVPNARVTKDLNTCQWLEEDSRPKTVKEFKTSMSTIDSEMALDPEDVRELAKEMGYQINISWTPGANDGLYDAIFWQNEPPQSVFTQFDKSQPQLDWDKFANNPIQSSFNQKIVPQLREHLLNTLPAYMIPANFMVINSLPLKPNGKVDRQALPEPQNSQLTQKRQIIVPQNELEQQIANIWQTVLPVVRIGIDDNFFDLGGHSLLMVQVCGKLKKDLNKDVAVVEMFQYPTIRKMANHLSQNAPANTNVFSIQARADKKKKALSRHKKKPGITR
ncbi:MAG: amino acid adenylation domain-containing protein [Thiomargarita sp.]|nr:amino acid adenylation domain-containing protein [Thiomargarita sp.]